MRRWFPKTAGLALALLLTAAALLAGRCIALPGAGCAPETLFAGAPTRDVPYAETRSEVVAAMLRLADVRRGGRLVDLGTGDGRILIAAARDFGAQGLGVDIDPALVRAAQANARAAGVAGRTLFRTEDLFETPLAEADVVAMFLLPEINLRLRPRILATMQTGARVVSHAFDMGEWRPDAETRVGGARVYLWVVPARAGG